jgi:hypothetical protein
MISQAIKPLNAEILECIHDAKTLLLLDMQESQTWANVSDPRAVTLC